MCVRHVYVADMLYVADMPVATTAMCETCPYTWPTRHAWLPAACLACLACLRTQTEAETASEANTETQTATETETETETETIETCSSERSAIGGL
jgi:hypothetical protein